eukprot:gnl/Trimastix_PCT/4754.p1 GENE.gnl/Trimastix_PCT/4754~~gnl/Trimastix_PCT/4754.p1  ORF type:complete len:205 (+),score=7.73 gnl/Trimastix_PCT/4754:19-633(+)
MEIFLVLLTSMASRHPVALFFLLFFKVAAFLIYLFCTTFANPPFVLIFIICILLFAFDFWTVKNVSGRLLVGLRWWNEVKPDGASTWNFESATDRSRYTHADSTFFWVSLVATPVVWVLMSVLAIFKPTWLMLCLAGVILSGTNLIGYLKCKKDARKNVTQFLTQQGLRLATSTLLNQADSTAPSSAPPAAPPTAPSANPFDQV